MTNYELQECQKSEVGSQKLAEFGSVDLNPAGFIFLQSKIENRKSKFCALFSLCLLLFAFTSCEYEEEVNLNADGSGELMIRARFSRALERTPFAFRITEENIRANLPEGMRLTGFRSFTQDDQQIYAATIEFDDVKKCSDAAGLAVFKTEFSAEKNSRGNYQLERTISAEGFQQLVTFRFILHTPTEIIDSNGDERVREPYKVAWEVTPSDLTSGPYNMWVEIAPPPLVDTDLFGGVLLALITVVAIFIFLRRRKQKIAH
ncbi:MAG: transmembrane domain-containing protein [Planctomycetes bacterium]|nr:transmembrane domain-containing protein [Planctomycetota bacterium]